MNLLKIHNLKKTFGGNILFDNVSMEVCRDDKVALIGRNGVGKSTLIKMILGDISPDSGEIFISNQAKLGYLSQDVLSKKNNTLYEEMLEVFSEVVAIEQDLKVIMKQLETDHSDELLNLYAKKEERFLFLGGYEYPTFIEMILTRFGFSKEDYIRYVDTFSGGEKTRVAFAKLLLQKPDILLLDEPTNHMDIEIIEWLEDYLKKYDGAVFVVTHDKYFINKVVNKIYEIDQNTLEVYYGKFDDYETQKIQRYELLMKQYLRQNKEIEHLQSFVDRFRYKATKAKSAQDRIKKLNRIERIDKPTNHHKKVQIAFKSKRPTDKVILETDQVSIGYDFPLYQNISFQMRGFEKIGMIGPNGAGKTTLIKTLIGDLEPLSGDVFFHKEMKIGYFDQNLAYLNGDLTLIETIHNIYPLKTLGEVRSLLAKLLFVGEDVFKKVSVLSGGEKVRLQLLLLMLEEPELLILDEPTNHLDIETKNIVEDIFEEFIGPIIFISHDRYFINKVATKIIAFQEKDITVFDGNYDEYKATIEPVVVKVEKPKKEKSVNTSKMIESKEKEFNNYHQEVLDLKKSLFEPEVYSNKLLYQEKEERIHFLEKKMEQLLEEIDDLS